jgi:hypothetical protein
VEYNSITIGLDRLLSNDAKIMTHAT